MASRDVHLFIVLKARVLNEKDILAVFDFWRLDPSDYLCENEKLARQAGMYLCRKYSGEKLREIGKMFNVGESAITEACRLFLQEMEKDKKLGREIDRVKDAEI